MVYKKGGMQGWQLLTYQCMQPALLLYNLLCSSCCLLLFHMTAHPKLDCLTSMWLHSHSDVQFTNNIPPLSHVRCQIRCTAERRGPLLPLQSGIAWLNSKLLDRQVIRGYTRVERVMANSISLAFIDWPLVLSRPSGDGQLEWTAWWRFSRNQCHINCQNMNLWSRLHHPCGLVKLVSGAPSELGSWDFSVSSSLPRNTKGIKWNQINDSALFPVRTGKQRQSLPK